MDDIIDELHELNQASALPLDLPSEDDLVEIEEEILIGLPWDLRQFLLRASDVIYGAMEPVTAADPRSHTYLPEVAAQAWDVGLPREYIPICEYDGGYACIAQDGKCYYWRDGDMLGEQWDDFWEWVKVVWLNRY